MERLGLAMSLDVMLMKVMPSEVYSANITHNLTKMASAAGLYEALWRPEEIGITHAEQLTPLLTAGLQALRDDPPKFQAMNPENGWGSYEVLVSFAEKYLAACAEHPSATITVWR